jgi:hypothetical protein
MGALHFLRAEAKSERLLFPVPDVVLLRLAGELIIRENWGTAEQNLGKREEHE